ncbi:flagellar biosynthetic protein FlhF [Thioflavicoccus mobilis 8321]|uniref:Flagellar biosynthesis protein FlhF n=1 Tax=Thioflavicoccus mobilis 8321 TaxID=765912 RepID=U3GL00_9GAMM|nr:flagellar biosynthesis protein FlhF [Thioflavicoccus mobilis]AGA89155.1 flagellar biosynthetic protein FlhF [Thioflavicoccus mobilis 8321]
MRIKRFLAPDMRQALRLVREDQGPDAVVVASRGTDAGIELLVALDYDEQLISTISETTSVAHVGGDSDLGPRARAWVNSADSSAPTAKEPIAQGLHPDLLDTMGNELRKLRVALEQQLSLLGGKDAGPAGVKLVASAERLGLDRSIFHELLAEARSNGCPDENLWSEVCNSLRARVNTVEDDSINRGGVFAFIGPTGVGKTTTVAKLAARFALRFGRRHIALITTDTYRIGAREQLLTFGEALGIPVDSATDREKLSQLLQEHARKRLILIDSAGLSQRDLRLAAQLSALDCIPLLKTYLVVSSATHPAGLTEVFRSFGRARLQGCVITKLDEAVTLGPMLGALARNQVPLAYVCDGQRVPEDIHPARAIDLLERAEALAEATSALDKTMEDLSGYRTGNGLL